MRLEDYRAFASPKTIRRFQRAYRALEAEALTAVGAAFAKRDVAMREFGIDDLLAAAERSRSEGEAALRRLIEFRCFTIADAHAKTVFFAEHDYGKDYLSQIGVRKIGEA